MVPNTFDDGLCAAISDAKPFGCPTTQERFSAGRSVQADIADDDIFFGEKRGIFRRVDHHPPARESFADVIIGIPLEFQRDTAGQKRTEALAS